MFEDFFRDKFQRDAAQTTLWIQLLEEKEDELTAEMRLTVSKILNGHHIWNARLRQVVPESELTDVLPLIHWKQLLEANLRETNTFLDDFSSAEKVRYHDSEGVQLERFTVDLLFQLLQDNQFYRGQLTLLAQQLDWSVRDFNLYIN